LDNRATGEEETEHGEEEELSGDKEKEEDKSVFK